VPWNTLLLLTDPAHFGVTHDHTIRVSPPLVVTCDEIDWALEQFDATLAHLGSG